MNYLDKPYLDVCPLQDYRLNVCPPSRCVKECENSGLIIWFTFGMMAVVAIGSTVTLWSFYYLSSINYGAANSSVAFLISSYTSSYLAGSIVVSILTTVICLLVTFAGHVIIAAYFLSASKSIINAMMRNAVYVFDAEDYFVMVIASQHMIVAGVTVKWFFTRDKTRLKMPILGAFRDLIVYHMGSVALGSFLIGFLKFLRYVIKFILRRVKWLQCTCCLRCVENIVKLISRNAYVEIARAISVLAENPLRFAALKAIGSFTLFLSKLLILAAVAAIGYDFFKDDTAINSQVLPIVIAVLFTYFIICGVFGIFEMMIDSIFICFCEDDKENNGVDKPYFMSRRLMMFAHNSCQMLENMKKTKRS